MEMWPWIDPVVLNHQLDCSVVRYLMLPTSIKLSVWLLVCSILSMSVPPDKDIFSLGGVSITAIPSDPPIAGESYTLVCSTGGSQAESLQWLVGPPDGRMLVVENSPRLIIITDATSSQLQFRPIQQSNNGSYSCNATTNGLTLTSQSVMISVNGILIPLYSPAMYHYYDLFLISSSPYICTGQCQWSYSNCWRRLSAHL